MGNVDKNIKKIFTYNKCLEKFYTYKKWSFDNVGYIKDVKKNYKSQQKYWREYYEEASVKAKKIYTGVRKQEYSIKPIIKMDVNRYSKYELGEKTPKIDRIFQSLLNESIEKYYEEKLKKFNNRVFSYRKNSSAQRLVKMIYESIVYEKYSYALKCDIVNFYDSIPHDKLKQNIDKFLNKDEKLIKKYLYKFIDAHYDTFEDFTSNVVSKEGISFTEPLSRALSNIYLYDLDVLILNELGKKYPIKYFRYCDDFVILFKDINDIIPVFNYIKDKIELKGLQLHELNTKSKIINLLEKRTKLEFLGFNISPKGIRIASSGIERIKNKIKRIIINQKNNRYITSDNIINKINAKILGSDSKNIFKYCNICGRMIKRNSWMDSYMVITDLRQLKALDNWIINQIKIYYYNRNKIRLSRKDLIERDLILTERLYYIYKKNYRKNKDQAYCECDKYLGLFRGMENIINYIHSNEPIYFIAEVAENYNNINESNDIQIFNKILYLERIDSYNNYEKEEFREQYFISIKANDLKNDINNINEGRFVYYIKEEQLLLNANNDLRAIRIRYNIFVDSKKVQTNYTSSKTFIKIKKSKNIVETYSYHVNVGSGNCTFVVFKYENDIKVIVIDCNQYDFKNHTYYGNNIETCIEYIKFKFNISKFKVDSLLITHPHYDHISGIDGILIKNGYIKQTEIWINTYYRWNGKVYGKILNFINNNIQKLKLTVIEPRIFSQNNFINILYPKFRMVNSKSDIKTNLWYKLPPDNKVNNISVVYRINNKYKSMILPGDIEEGGWNSVENCCPQLSNADYYCVSHHGSITGHKRNLCPKNRLIKKITCNCINSKINILMGRDKAYSGIFSKEVINDFCGNLYRTDKSNKSSKEVKFLQLNWQDDSVKYDWELIHNNSISRKEVAIGKNDKFND